MGSVLSFAYAALCSFVKAQLDKAEERRLMAIFPGLRDLSAKERERTLRWLMDHDGDRPHPVADDDRWQDPNKGRCNGTRSADLSQLAVRSRCNYRLPRFRVRDKTASK